MNELNYATLEASKRLVAAGIVLETEAVWRKKRDNTGYYLSRKALYHRTSDAPAPSMAEVWRELPDIIKTDHGLSFLSIRKVVSHADDLTYINAEYDHSPNSFVRNDNPTDALIDLLIWVRKEAEDANP